MEKKFENKRYFQVWGYTVSHSILLLRSPNLEENFEAGYNVDIEFWGVDYIDLPTHFYGISIEEVFNITHEKLKEYSNELGYKIFKITTNGRDFYIVAANYRVGKNNWLNENRIIDPYLEYDEIVFESKKIL